ncbi:MAG: hypothetical protein VB934_14200 [Polyangiaceae bacterium]
MFTPKQLHAQSRDELIERARGFGVVRPEVLTQAELVDEIVKHGTPVSRRRSVRGWLGRARDLVAQVIDKGLHLPEAAKMFLAPLPADSLPTAPPPLATVTLAEIYAAQGYFDKAIRVLDEVVGSEPEHREARVLRDRFAAAADTKRNAKRGLGGQASGESTDAADLPKASASVVTDAAVAADVPEKTSPSNGAAKAQAAKASSTAEPEAETKGETGPGESIERDELLASATNARTIQLSWTLRPLRLARARARSEEGLFVLHLLTIDVEKGALRSQARDVPIVALRGELALDDMVPGAEIRACLAWRAGDRLTPFTVAPGLRMPATD